MREAVEEGVELAYVVTKDSYRDLWTLATIGEYPSAFDGRVPGMCVEGVRVRSTPAGYEGHRRAPWVLANLTGQDAPKTNVARTDVEETPELQMALYRIYKLLGTHVQLEFDRLVAKNSGIVAAASEADLIRQGMERSAPSSPRHMYEAMGELRIIALEDHNQCRTVTKKEMQGLSNIWTADSALISNIEGICSSLGIDHTAERIMSRLGRKMEPAIPVPRVLGHSKYPILGQDIVEIRLLSEGRGHRLEVCWGAQVAGRWTVVPKDIISYKIRKNYSKVMIAHEVGISVPRDYDLVVWRGWCLLLASSIVPELLAALGMSERFTAVLHLLLETGGVPLKHRPLLRERLIAAIGKEGDNLLARLVLPFERRLGDFARETEMDLDDIGL